MPVAPVPSYHFPSSVQTLAPLAKISTDGANKPPNKFPTIGAYSPDPDRSPRWRKFVTGQNTIQSFPGKSKILNNQELNSIKPFHPNTQVVPANIHSGNPVSHEIKPFHSPEVSKFFLQAQAKLQTHKCETLKELFSCFHQIITEGRQKHNIVSNPKLEKILAERALKIVNKNQNISQGLSARELLRRVPVGAWVKALENNMPPELEQLIESSGYSGKEAETMFLNKNTSIPLSGSAQSLKDDKQLRELLELYSFLGSAHPMLEGILRGAKANGLLEFSDYKFIDSANIPIPSPTEIIPFNSEKLEDKETQLLIFDLQGSTPTALKSSISKLDIHKIVNYILGITDKAYYMKREGDAGQLLVKNFSEEQITKIYAANEVFRRMGLNFRFTVVDLTEEIIKDNNLEVICDENGLITNLHNASIVEGKIKDGLIKGLSPSNQEVEKEVEALEELFGLKPLSKKEQKLKKQRANLEKIYAQDSSETPSVSALTSSSISRIRALAPDGYQVRTLSVIVGANASPEQVAGQIRGIFNKPLISQSDLEPDQNGVLPRLADENGHPLEISLLPNLNKKLIDQFNNGYKVVHNKDGTKLLILDIVSKNNRHEIQSSLKKLKNKGTTELSENTIQLSIVSPPTQYSTLDINPDTKTLEQGILGAYPNSIWIKSLDAAKKAEEFRELESQSPNSSNLPALSAIGTRLKGGSAPNIESLEFAAQLLLALSQNVPSQRSLTAAKQSNNN